MLFSNFQAMKTTCLSIIAWLIAVITFGQSGAIVGQWYTDGKESIIEVYEQNNKYYGKLIWLEEPRDENGKIKRDAENPDESLRDRPLKGLVLMKGLTYDSDDKEWVDGEIYDPESGNTYSCHARLKNSDVLYLRGYMGISLIGRTTEWVRKE